MSFRNASLPVELSATVCPPLLTRTEQRQISGHHDKHLHKVYWNKGLTLLPDAFIHPRASLYSIMASVQYAAVLLNDYSAWLVMPERKSLFGSPYWRIIVAATRKESSTLYSTHLQLVLWQASLVALKAPRGDSVVWAACHSQSCSLPTESSPLWAWLDIQDRMYKQEDWEEAESPENRTGCRESNVKCLIHCIWKCATTIKSLYSVFNCFPPLHHTSAQIPY